MVKKLCTKCGLTKSEVEFYRLADGTLQGWCKSCRRSASAAYYASDPQRGRDRAVRRRQDDPRRDLDSRLRSTYGITLAQYEAMLEDQGGGCAVCGTGHPGGRGRFHVDHDHGCCPGKKSCGECVRGLLCSKCNSVLGYFEDDVRRFSAAIDYLDRWTIPVAA